MLTRDRAFYAARIVGALGWSTYELGKRDGMKSGREMDLTLEQWTGDEKKWVAAYKYEFEEEDRA